MCTSIFLSSLVAEWAPSQAMISKNEGLGEKFCYDTLSNNHRTFYGEKNGGYGKVEHDILIDILLN